MLIAPSTWPFAKAFGPRTSTTMKSRSTNFRLSYTSQQSVSNASISSKCLTANSDDAAAVSVTCVVIVVLLLPQFASKGQLSLNSGSKSRVVLDGARRRHRCVAAYHPRSLHGRGRDEDCSSPPAQIPACAANAPGSSLGFWRRSDDRAKGAAF